MSLALKTPEEFVSTDLGSITLGASALCSADIISIIEMQKKIRQMDADQTLYMLSLGKDVYDAIGVAVETSGMYQAQSMRDAAYGQIGGGCVGVTFTGVGMGQTFMKPDSTFASAEANAAANGVKNCKTALDGVNTKIDETMQPAYVADVPAAGTPPKPVQEAAHKFGDRPHTDADFDDILRNNHDGKPGLDSIKQRIERESEAHQKVVDRFHESRQTVGRSLGEIGSALSQVSQGSGQAAAADQEVAKANQERLRAEIQFSSDSARTEQDVYQKQAEEAKGSIQQSVGALELLAQMSGKA